MNITLTQVVWFIGYGHLVAMTGIGHILWAGGPIVIHNWIDRVILLFFLIVPLIFMRDK